MPHIRSTTPRGCELVADRLPVWRVVAAPEAIDQLSGSVLRIAPDDALVLEVDGVKVDDPEAIVEPDAGWVKMSMSEERAIELISVHASWRPPSERPVLAQGMLGGLPAKVYLDGEATMIIVAAPFESELEERLSR